MRFFAFLLLFLGGCGDPVERHIAALVEGGDEAEVARMELNLAKQDEAEVALEGAFPAAGLDGGAIAPGAVWGFNICPVRVTNLSEFSQWAPTYGDSQRPDRLGYLVFGD